MGLPVKTMKGQGCSQHHPQLPDQSCTLPESQRLLRHHTLIFIQKRAIPRIWAFVCPVPPTTGACVGLVLSPAEVRQGGLRMYNCDIQPWILMKRASAPSCSQLWLIRAHLYTQLSALNLGTRPLIRILTDAAKSGEDT